MNRGHTPIRTCLGCRRKRPAKEMIRLKAADGLVVVVESRSTIGGRGCYICPTLECAENAKKKRRFERALRSEFRTIPPAEIILKKGLEKKGCADDHHDR